MNGADVMAAPWRGPVEDPETVEAPGLRLTDLSRRRRFGVKGRGALAWLGGQGLAVAVENNRSATTEGRILLARLGPGEAVMLAVGDGGGAVLDGLAERLERDRPAGCHAVPRQDMSAWFRLAGPAGPAVLAHLCAVDLRTARFPDGGVAQTSVASQNAVVVRDDRDDGCGFHLLTDFASGAYLWRTLARQAGSGDRRAWTVA
jgi:sarcosine oxidase subunit gamma